MISLVVTTYNHAAYIREALDSILLQNLENMQVIIIDDGSIDSTLDIILEYKRFGFTIFTKTNGGPSNALNYAVSRTNGDFIVLLSGDDKLEPKSIEERVSVLQSKRADIVSAIPRWIDSDSNLLPVSSHPPLFKYYSFKNTLDLFSLLYRNGNIICAPSVAMTRNCWETVGTFNEDLWQLQDYEYWLRACAKSQVFHCMSEPCVSYRWHGRNLSLSNRRVSEKELDLVLMNAPDWLNDAQLAYLLWGEDQLELSEIFDAEMLRALVRIKHPRQNVRDGGSWQLRTISNDAHRRNILLKHLY